MQRVRFILQPRFASIGEGEYFSADILARATVTKAMRRNYFCLVNLDAKKVTKKQSF